MELETVAIERTDAPTDRPVEALDVRELGPPEPLRRTLELLADLSDGTVLVQRNDRAPRFLYPKLDDRGYAHETIETDDAVVTAIWTEGSDDAGSGGLGDADATAEEDDR